MPFLVGSVPESSLGPFSATERSCLEPLPPKVCRSVPSGDSLNLQEVERAVLADVLDGLSTGVFLVDARGRLISANVAGLAMIRSGSPARRAGDILVLSHRPANRALQSALAAAKLGQSPADRKGFCVPFSGPDNEPYIAHVLPLRAGAPKDRIESCPRAAVFVRKARLEQCLGPAAVSALYGLTKSELRVLRAIVEVGGGPAVAEAHGVSEGTVRTHLKRIFAKTGTHRQADLVKLVAAMASPLAPRDIIGRSA